jgi:hypothetical protein
MRLDHPSSRHFPHRLCRADDESRPWLLAGSIWVRGWHFFLGLFSFRGTLQHHPRQSRRPPLDRKASTAERQDNRHWRGKGIRGNGQSGSRTHGRDRSAASLILGDSLEGEARELGKVTAGIARQVAVRVNRHRHPRSSFPEAKRL